MPILMLFQYSAGRLPLMSNTIRARIGQRTRAEQRLSDLTLATAFAGLAATIGFGGLAAATYAGNASTQVAPGAGLDGVTVPGTQGDNGSSTTNGGSTTARPTPRPKPNSNSGSSSNGSSSRGVSGSSGRAHVSSGSS